MVSYLREMRKIPKEVKKMQHGIIVEFDAEEEEIVKNGLKRRGYYKPTIEIIKGDKKQWIFFVRPTNNLEDSVRQFKCIAEELFASTFHIKGPNGSEQFLLMTKQ